MESKDMTLAEKCFRDICWWLSKSGKVKEQYEIDLHKSFVHNFFYWLGQDYVLLKRNGRSSMDNWDIISSDDRCKLVDRWVRSIFGVSDEA